MTKSTLHTLSPKNGLDDPSLLRVVMNDLLDQVYEGYQGPLPLQQAKHVEALGTAGPQEVTGKSDFDCYPKELARRQRTDEQQILDLGRSLVCREGGDGW